MGDTPPVAVTGIKPSGTPHLGNYLGMMRPALRRATEVRSGIFIADGHALTSVTDPDELRRLTHEAAATLLALGLDPARTMLYRQSDVPEVFELAWVLACSTPKGLLNRAHAYKSKVDENRASGRTDDAGVSAGLFTYPVLMAADILLFDAKEVPVGRDQVQHVEIARDIAESFNRSYGEILVLPQPVVDDSVAVIPGLDGRKMSKTYDNVIPIFGSADEVRRRVLRIVTDSRRPEEPKDPDTDPIFAIYRHVGSADDVASMRRRYSDGGIGYAEAKDALAEALERTFGEARDRYTTYVADTDRLGGILADGADRARHIALRTLYRVRNAVGC